MTLSDSAAAVGAWSPAQAIGAWSGPQQLPTPTDSPGAGSYGSSQSVTLSGGASSPDLYYTTNGDTPTSGSTHYIGAFSIASTSTLKAIGIQTGWADSAVLSTLYTITAGGVIRSWWLHRPLVAGGD